MKKSELRKIIREEIREYTQSHNTPTQTVATTSFDPGDTFLIDTDVHF